jgi:hypothetical protein
MSIAVNLKGFLEECVPRTNVSPALKMERQDRIKHDDGGRAVVARYGGSSRQIGVIDDQGSIEEREDMVVLVGGSDKERIIQGYTPNREEGGS